MSLNSWLTDMKPVPAWCRQSARLILKALLWGAVLTILSAILIAVLVQEPQGMTVRLWLENARFPLLVWRLTLYAVLAGLWFGGVRAYFMARIRAREDWRALSSLRRLEVMAIALMALSEYNVWLAPH